MAEKETSAAKSRAKGKDGDLKKARALREASEAIDALHALVQHQPAGKAEFERYFLEVRRLVSVAYRPAMQSLQNGLLQKGWTKQEIAAAEKIALPKAKTRGAKRSQRQ